MMCVAMLTTAQTITIQIKKTLIPQGAMGAAMPVNVWVTLTVMEMWMERKLICSEKIFLGETVLDYSPATVTLTVMEMWMERKLVCSKKMFLEEIVLPIAIRQGVKTGMSIN